MSRKPIDKQQPSECRQAIWNWIREHNYNKQTPLAFFIKDIDVKLDATSIRDYLTGLFNAGYLGVFNDPYPPHSKAEPIAYYLKEDTGIDAPRVRKDGSPVTQGQGQQYMWNTMRILKEFSAYDLAFNASTDELTIGGGTALKYCAALCKAGYLIAIKDRRFRLLPSQWTGPQPPQIQRTKQIYDPNLQRVVWNKIEGGAH